MRMSHGIPPSGGQPTMNIAHVGGQVREARFVTGSTMRHVVVMTFTSSVGLMAIFLVDFADMYFLSLLGEEEVAGAIGYAGAIVMLNVSICLGLTIAMTAVVSRCLGAGDAVAAERLAARTLVFSVGVATGLAVILWLSVPYMLDLLGATGATRGYGLSYARIIVPSLPFFAIGMCLGGILRALGDARRAMWVTLTGAIVNGVLDPIFIFGFGWGVDGAAWASVCARLAMLVAAFHSVHAIHRFRIRPRYGDIFGSYRPIAAVAIPAMLTNIATPVGSAIVVYAMSPYGDAAMAGLAIILRLAPVAFGVVFALSGAVGPIIGQNYGALRLDRVRQTLNDALLFTVIYVIAVALVLFALQDALIAVFRASGQAAELIVLFCTFLAITWVFQGAQFVANAAFNNLGKAHYSTLFNWTKATVGLVPLVAIGGYLGGAEGVMIGYAMNGVLFGIAAVLVAYGFTGRLREMAATTQQETWNR